MYINDECYVKDSCVRVCQRKEDCPEYCTKFIVLRGLYKKALIPKTFLNSFKVYGTTEHDNKMYRMLVDYENNIVENVMNGNSLYIYSANCGNGKTSWALRLLKSYLNKQWIYNPTALYVNIPKYMIELKNSFSDPNNEYIRNVHELIYDADIVVWDEIAEKCGTEFELDRLLSIINDRIGSGKCNIYTSNANPNTLSSYVGARLYSRIYNGSAIVNFDASDYRAMQTNKR